MHEPNRHETGEKNIRELLDARLAGLEQEIVAKIQSEQLQESDAERLIAAEQARAAEEPLSEEILILPDTLEYPQLITPTKTLPSRDGNTARHITATTGLAKDKTKHKVGPRVLALASCVSVVLAGGAMVSGYDSNVIGQIRGPLEASSSTPPSIEAHAFSIKLPNGLLASVQTEKSETRHNEKTEKSNPTKLKATTKQLAPAPQAQPRSIRRPVEKTAPVAPKKATSKPHVADTPKGLTKEEADPDNYNSSSARSAGGASYGNIPTPAGGAEPFIAD